MSHESPVHEFGSYNCPNDWSSAQYLNVFPLKGNFGIHSTKAIIHRLLFQAMSDDNDAN